MVQLSESVGMVPLAEGIETEEQSLFLVEHGCTLGQGFYFGRPVAADEITPRARSGSALPLPQDGPRRLDAAG
jgi:EAL domain-containing protein (putative c-di-GMP-specific phosphodiesterase class I)